MGCDRIYIYIYYYINIHKQINQYNGMRWVFVLAHLNTCSVDFRCFSAQRPHPGVHHQRLVSNSVGIAPFKVGEVTSHLGVRTVHFPWCSNKTLDYWNLQEAFVCVENSGLVGSLFGNSTLVEHQLARTPGVFVESQTFGAALMFFVGQKSWHQRVPSCEADGFGFLRKVWTTATKLSKLLSCKQ